MAESLNLKPSDILIYFNGEDDTFDDVKTLKDANVTLGTILEASRSVPIPAPGGVTAASSTISRAPRDPDIIRLKLQSTEKSGCVTLEINKHSPLKELRAQYAIKMNLNVSQVKFKFDGEILDLDETPVDLELEGGECIDVLVS